VLQAVLSNRASGICNLAALNAGLSKGSSSVGRIRPSDILPAPQLLTVMITGCVLNEVHIAAGSYIPAGEQARALQLLQGEKMQVLVPSMCFGVSMLLDSCG
jgi:hypothetical protein